MNIQYDLERLRRILGDLSTLTGISLSVLDAKRNGMILCAQENDYCTTIQQQGDFEKCRSCDMALLDRCEKSRAVERHTCHAGLCDLAMPVTKDGMVVGFLLMGRVRSPQSPVQCGDASLESLYRQIPLFSEEKILSLVDLLPQILFESTVILKPDTLFRQAQAYIRQHLQEELSIERLCEVLHVSKNKLYSAFASQCGTTVNAYITQQRLERAKQLLRETDEPVYRVAEAIGIRNYTYFCRLFKGKTSLSPLAYRRSGKK